MTLKFILNGEDVVTETRAETRLVDVLRSSFRLLGTKAGCYAGNCGACSVLLNGDVVKSCLVQAFKAMDCEIVTIEGFSQSEEYKDIFEAYTEAGTENCGFCSASKILSTEALLNRNLEPSRNEILAAFQGINCRCSDPELMLRAVTGAIENRKRRLNGRS